MRKLFSSLAMLFCLGANSQAMAAELPADVVWLDVRSQEEFASGHIDGALNIPHTEINASNSLSLGDKDRPVYVYCRSGHRAGIALDKLKALGFTNAVNIGGLGDANKLLQSATTGSGK